LERGKTGAARRLADAQLAETRGGIPRENYKQKKRGFPVTRSPQLLGTGYRKRNFVPELTGDDVARIPLAKSLFRFFLLSTG
jgi:hypothetical protein